MAATGAARTSSLLSSTLSGSLKTACFFRASHGCAPPALSLARLRARTRPATGGFRYPGIAHFCSVAESKETIQPSGTSEDSNAVETPSYLSHEPYKLKALDIPLEDLELAFSPAGSEEAQELRLRREQREFEESPLDLNAIEEENARDNRLYSEIILIIRGFDPQLMTSYLSYVRMAAYQMDIKCSELIKRPVYRKRLTVIKSPFKYKKHKRQFEQRYYSYLVTLQQLTGPTADVFLEYIQRNLPEGLMMSVLKESLEHFPFSDDQLAHVKAAVKETISTQPEANKKEALESSAEKS